jgi:endogenous inhibitor of DNA gyrase (YacG/DUF329 family)
MKQTKEHIRKRVDKLIGRIRVPKNEYSCATCHKLFKAYPKEQRTYCSRKCADISTGKRMIGRSFVKGKHWKVKDTSKYHKKLSEETKKKIGETRVGEKHWNWKGGTSRAYKDGYYSVEYKQWRMGVFVRDAFTCQICGVVGGKLQAHHIKSFKNFPELRFVLDNGVCLCAECHRKTDNYGGNKKNFNKNHS